MLSYCTQLYVPILDKSHYILFVINADAGNIQILDSNPYQEIDTVGIERHKALRMLSGSETEWAPTLMSRLSSALHEVRPNIGIPNFEKWDIELAENIPTMKNLSNDCGFYVMRYMQFYDPMRAVMTRNIQQVCPLTTLIFKSTMLIFKLFYKLL